MSPALQALDQHECSESRPVSAMHESPVETTTALIDKQEFDVDFHVITDGLGLKTVVLDRVSVPHGCGDNIRPYLAQGVINQIVRQVRDQLGIGQAGYSHQNNEADYAWAHSASNPVHRVQA